MDNSPTPDTTNEMTTAILTYPTDLTHPFFNGKTDADIKTLHAIINTAAPFTADEPEDEWENDELCLELNHGFCVMEGRHADTNDADWELFIRATETDEYTEELYVELQTRLAARTDDDASSVNTQEVCCECELTEKQISNGRNIQTLHYIYGKTYCLNCREPENSDDESVCDDEQRSYGARGAPAPESDTESDCSDGRDRDDDEMSECEECGERYELGDFNCVESGMKQYCYCDDCFATKIKDGEVIKNPEEEDEWIFACDD